MGYNVTFMVDKNTIAANNIAPIFDNYEWWTDLEIYYGYNNR